MSTAQKYKTRVSVKLFMSGPQIESKWIIEAKLASGWMMVGDDKGIQKFSTKEEAEKAAAAFNE